MYKQIVRIENIKNKNKFRLNSIQNNQFLNKLNNLSFFLSISISENSITMI